MDVSFMVHAVGTGEFEAERQERPLPSAKGRRLRTGCSSVVEELVNALGGGGGGGRTKSQ